MNLISNFIKTGGESSRLLTTEEELKLCKDYHLSRDIKVRNEIANHNLGLVFSISKEYPTNVSTKSELVNEGCIGLLKGIEKFDPDRGLKLSTYIVWWIRAYMLDFIVNNARLVKLGTTTKNRALFWNLSKERAKLESKGIEATAEALAESLVASVDDVREMEARMSSDKSIDSSDADPRNPGFDFMPNQKSLKSKLVDDKLLPTDSFLYHEKKSILQKQVNAFMDILPLNERIVFENRILCDPEDQETLEVVSQKLTPTVSKERVRQIHEHVVAKFTRFTKVKRMEKLL